MFRLYLKPGLQGKLTGMVLTGSKLAVAPDGKTLAVTLSRLGNRKELELFVIYLETGRIMALPGVGKGGNFEQLGLFRDGQMLAGGIKHDGKDKTAMVKVCLWRDLAKASGSESPAPALAKRWQFKCSVADMVFAPDGSKLAVSHGFQGGPIRLLNMKDLEATAVEINPETRERVATQQRSPFGLESEDVISTRKFTTSNKVRRSRQE